VPNDGLQNGGGSIEPIINFVITEVDKWRRFPISALPLAKAPRIDLKIEFVVEVRL
jgi:hypothetical protein